MPARWFYLHNLAVDVEPFRGAVIFDFLYIVASFRLSYPTSTLQLLRLSFLQLIPVCGGFAADTFFF